MALLTQDWTGLDYLPWGWYVAAFGDDNPLYTYELSTDGLSFTDWDGIYYNKGLLTDTGTTELEGTAIVKFKVKNLDGINEFYNIDFYYGLTNIQFGAYLKANVSDGTLALTLGHQGEFNDLLWLVGEITEFDSLTAGSTGSILSVLSNDGTLGTIVSSLYYGGLLAGTATTTWPLSIYNPSEGTKYTWGHVGHNVSGRNNLYITSGTYLATPLGAAPLAVPTFFYDGYYNNGSSQGVVNLTTDLISISPIQDAITMAGQSGGFDARVTVVLDNSSAQWGTFTGFSASGYVYNPPGIFHIRDLYINGASQDIFIGFGAYENLKFNDLNKTVSLEIKSITSMLNEYAIIPPSYIGAKTGVPKQTYNDSIFNVTTFGTVHSVTGNVGEVGTLVMYYDRKTPVIALDAGDMIVESGGKDAAFVGSFLGSSGAYYGTYTIEVLPDWMQVNTALCANKSVMLDTLSVADFYTTQINSAIMFTWSPYYGGAYTNPNWSISSILAESCDNVILSPNFRYRGNEKPVEILNDIINTTGGFYSYFNSRLQLFTPSLTMMVQPSVGTIDYQTDAYGAFIYNQNFKTKSVSYQYAYNDLTRKYNLSLYLPLDDSETVSGIEKSFKTRLLQYTEDALQNAYIIGLFYQYNIELSIILDSSKYSICQPGRVITISNTPSDFQIETNKFLVIERIFDPSTKMITCKFMGIPNLEDDYFRVSIDSIGGTARGIL